MERDGKMPKEKESFHFECDDPEVLKKIKKARDEKGSLRDGLMSLLKEKAKENVDEGIESTKETVIEEETLEEDERFPCDKLCKRFRSCTRNAVFSKGEIKAEHCYISKFPYEWTTPDGRDVRLCKFMVFESTQPYGDPDHPYPQCIAKQKDVPFQLPRDRIMRNPEICWSCYKMRKKAREEQFKKKYVKQDYHQRMGDGIDPRSLTYDLGDGY